MSSGEQRNFDELYQRIGELVATVPNIDAEKDTGDVSPETHLWLGRCYACVKEALGDGQARLVADMTNVVLNHVRIGSALRAILANLYRALAVVELKASPGLVGTFIPAKDAFSAMQAVSKVLREAKTNILVVDPYLNGSFLTDFAENGPEGVALRLLTKTDTPYKDNLRSARQRWLSSFGARRPLEVRLVPPKALHDRIIAVDGEKVWSVGQSFKDLAVRSPTAILRIPTEVADAKLEAYGELWKGANQLAEE